MSSESAAGQKTSFKIKHFLDGFRKRVITMMLAVYVFSFLTVSWCMLYFTYKHGNDELTNALTLTANSFNQSCSQEFENLAVHAGVFASDAQVSNLFKNYPDAQSALDSISKEQKNIISNDIMLALAGWNDDFLLITDKNDKVCFSVMRSSDNSLNSENAKDSGKKSGDSFEQNKIEAAFFDSVRSAGSAGGFVKADSSDSVYFVSAALLDKSDPNKGAVILGKRISELSLVRWSQGMPAGVLLFTSDSKVLFGYDKRSVSAPSPVFLAEMEKIMTGWNPKSVCLRPVSGSKSSMPGELHIIGKKWHAASSEILSAGKSEVLGYIVFLADTDLVSKEVKQMLSLLSVLFIIDLAFVLIFAYFGGRFLLGVRRNGSAEGQHN